MFASACLNANNVLQFCWFAAATDIKYFNDAEQKSPTECCGDEFVVVGGQLADCVYWLLLAKASPTQPPTTNK